MSPDDPQMTLIWPPDDPRMIPRWSPDDPQMVKQKLKKCQKTNAKKSKTQSDKCWKIVPGWPRMTPGWPLDDSWMTPGWFPDDPQLQDRVIDHSESPTWTTSSNLTLGKRSSWVMLGNQHHHSLSVGLQLQPIGQVFFRADFVFGIFWLFRFQKKCLMEKLQKTDLFDVFGTSCNL